MMPLRAFLAPAKRTVAVVALNVALLCGNISHFTSATGILDIVDIFCHFDYETDLVGFDLLEGIVTENIIPQVVRFIFPVVLGLFALVSGRPLNLGFASGHLSFVMPCSSTNLMLFWPVILRLRMDTKAHMMERRLQRRICVQSKLCSFDGSCFLH